MKLCSGKNGSGTLATCITILAVSWVLPTPAVSEDRNVNSYWTNGGSQFISQECSELPRRKRSVRVSDLALVCDAGDDSGNDYRDRVVCLSGDTAKVAVDFDVFNSEKRDNTTVFIDLEARVMGKKVYLYNHTSLCNVDSVAYWGDRDEGDDVYSNNLLTACPIQNGMFSLFFNFEVPETSRDASLELTPDIRVRFYDVSRNKIGCVESGDLAKYAFSQEMEQKGQRFFVFSILLFCGLFAFCMIGHQRRQRREERKAVKKQASRMRRFHYIQTSRSGEVQMTTSPSLLPSFSYDHCGESR